MAQQIELIIQDNLEIANAFTALYEEEKSKLPFQLNVVDELFANENAHSRILAQLLRYRKSGSYPFLSKFLNQLGGFKLPIEKPIVGKVDSSGRIDIPIFDKQYVVIIENKVTDKAVDQNVDDGGQLARYIESIHENYSRPLNEIFVVYLPKYAREASNDCWQSRSGNSYQEEFKERYKSLSYRDDIHPWLKNEILPSIPKEEVQLYCALMQYIDHLEGIFGTRKIEEEMNSRLEEFLKDKLELKEKTPNESMALLSEKEAEMNHILSCINELKKGIVQDSFAKWKEQLALDFPNCEIVGDIFKESKRHINVGIILEIDGLKFSAMIECDDYSKSNVYFGIGKHYASLQKHNIPLALQQVITVNTLETKEYKQESDWWYGWKYTTMEETYEQLRLLIKEIQKAASASMN